MSAFERAVRSLVLAAGAAAVACSLVTDFDASKIPPDGTGGATGGAGGLGSGGFITSGGSSNGGALNGGALNGGFENGGAPIDDSGGTGNVDASTGGTSSGGASENGGAAGQAGGGAGGAIPPPACTVGTNKGCAADELCCAVGQSVTCRKTSLKECSACGVPCAEGLALSCNARVCECGTGAGHACSGKDTERFCAMGSPAECMECRDATDCAGRADGKTRCVSGQCSLCDPSQSNAGCAGKTPICDPKTLSCKACTVTPDDCRKPLVCTASGACGSCASSTDCSTPTSPICDTTTTQCRPCATNAECVAGPKLPFCVTQTCSSCNPTTEAGCADPTKPDCRGDAKGGYSCQGCTNNGECAGHPGTVCDPSSHRCVPCVGDDDCSANASAPFCVNNQCVACDTSSPVAVIADLRCVLKAGGQPVCIRTGTQKGTCGTCDPGGSRGCTNNQLCCESKGVAACVGTSPAQCTGCGAPACNPLVADSCSARACQCGTNAACSGTGTTRFCVGSPAACGECRNDADCPSATAPLCEGNRCVGCDQAASSSNRCAAKAAGTVCATTGALRGRCAACDPATSAGCSAATGLDQCDPATATCVDCVDNAGCSGTLDRCNTPTKKCVDCDAIGGCSGTLDRCDLAAGKCVDCDAMGGCTLATLPICAASTCRACASDAECVALASAAGPLCAANGACTPDAACAKNDDCADGVHVVCAGLLADGGGVGHCRVCDPATNAGCAGTQTCSIDFVCTGG